MRIKSSTGALVRSPLLNLSVALGLAFSMLMATGTWSPALAIQCPQGQSNVRVGNDKTGGCVDDDDGTSGGGGENDGGGDDNQGFGGAIGGQGNGDTEEDSPEGDATATSTGGNSVNVTFFPDNSAARGDNPSGIAGCAGQINLVSLTVVQILPNGTPNFVNLTLSYTDEQVRHTFEDTLFAAVPDGAGGWRVLMAVPGDSQNTVTRNPALNQVMVQQIDVSAFAGAPTPLAVFGCAIPSQTA